MSDERKRVDRMPLEALCLGPEREALLRGAGFATLGDIRARLRDPKGPPDLGTAAADIDWRLVGSTLAFFDREPGADAAGGAGGAQ